MNPVHVQGMTRSATRTSSAVCVFAGLLLAGSAACNIIQPPLPNAIDGVTLATIRTIQQDAQLTPDDRVAMVEELLGLDDSPQSARIAMFLLSLNLTSDG